MGVSDGYDLPLLVQVESGCGFSLRIPSLFFCEGELSTCFSSAINPLQRAIGIDSVYGEKGG